MANAIYFLNLYLIKYPNNQNNASIQRLKQNNELNISQAPHKIHSANQFRDQLIRLSIGAIILQN